MFTNTMRKCKVGGMISFITAGGESSTKGQVELASAEENVIVDVYEDPGENPDDELHTSLKTLYVNFN